jgi:hypothetical protein
MPVIKAFFFIVIDPDSIFFANLNFASFVLGCASVSRGAPCSADHEQITTGYSSSLCVNLSVLGVSAVTASYIHSTAETQRTLRLAQRVSKKRLQLIKKS